jgi:hypothetical protein
LVLVRTKSAYKLWHDGIINLTRVDRYTIGCKIDNIFVSLLSLIFKGCYASDKFEKLSTVSEAIAQSDQLKFFLQLGWEQKIIDHKQYATLIIYLDEIGRMLGGWKNSLKDKTPTRK